MFKKHNWVKYAAFIMIACQLSLASFAGENKKEFSGKKVEIAGRQLSYQTKLNKTFSDFEVYQIDQASVYNHIQNSAYYKEFSLKLGDKLWEFELEPFDVRSEDYKMLVAASEGIEVRPKTPVTIYRGIANNDPNQRALFQITENKMFGYIKEPGDEIYIEQISTQDQSVNDDLFVVYKADDLDNQLLSEIKCDLEQKVQMDVSIRQSEINSGPCKLAEYAVASDWRMTKDYGGVEGNENEILLLLSLVQEQYDLLDIQFVLVTTFVVEEAGADPFWPDNDDMDDALPDFRDWVGAGGFGTTSFDLASLWSTRDWCSTRNGNCGVAGRAWVNSICTTSRTNVLQNFTSSRALSATIQAHEAGHTFGAGHRAQGSGTIMTPTASATATGWVDTSMWEIADGAAKSCISGCNVAPYADFEADLTLSCNGTVTFTDKSQLDPISYSWDFGDGNTSTDQNPTHTYSSGGSYTVKLTATNANGSDVETKTNYIKVPIMDQLPGVSAGTGCTGETRTLTATPANAGSIEWYDSKEKGKFLHLGNNFNPSVSETTTYYAVEVSNHAIKNVGPDYQESMARADDRDSKYLSFDVYNDALLKSVEVFSDLGGQHTIEMADKNGTVIASKVVHITVGLNRVELNFKLTPGTDYRLQVNGFVGDLHRSTGIKFPYTLKNALSITYGSGGLYYYFYDWEVRVGCFTERVPVVAEACPSSSLVENTIDVKLYPNPSQGIYNLELSAVPGGHVLLTVYNILGEEIRHLSWKSNTQKVVQKLDLTDVPDGTYFLKLEAGDNHRAFQKIVKH